MKKAIVLLLALVAIGGFVFAEDAPASPWTLTGNAWAKWGMNIDTSKMGFNNGYDLEMNYKLADIKGGATGEGVYGKIDITDLALNISADDTIDVTPTLDAFDGSVSASIVAGALTVGIYDKPSFTFNNAAYLEPFSVDGYGDLSSSVKSKIRATQSIKGGISVAYAFGTLGKVEARIASMGDWGATAGSTGTPIITYVTKVATATVPGTLLAGQTVYYDMAGALLGAGAVAADTMYVEKVTTAGTDVAASADDRYLFAGYLTLTPVAMATVNAGFMMNPDTEYTGFTGKLTLAPIADLTVTAGFDGVKATSSADLQMDVAGTVAYKLNEGKDTVTAGAYFANDKANGASYGRLDAGLKFTDAEGFVPGLTVDFGAYLNDLIKDPANDPQMITVIEKLSYKVALSDATYIKPYEAYGTDLGAKQAYLNVGADAKLFANTVLTLDYKFGAINDDKAENEGLLTGASADIAKGVLSLQAKISF